MLLHNNEEFRVAVAGFINRMVSACVPDLWAVAQAEIALLRLLLGRFLWLWIIQLLVHCNRLWNMTSVWQFRRGILQDNQDHRVQRRPFWPIDVRTAETIAFALNISVYFLMFAIYGDCSDQVWRVFSIAYNSRLLPPALYTTVAVALAAVLFYPLRVKFMRRRVVDPVRARFLIISMPGHLIVQSLLYFYRAFLTRQIIHRGVRKAETYPYTYQSLAPNTRSFRLLRLSRVDGLLQCTLEIHSLDNQPTYDAVSYIWGNTDPAYSLKTADSAKIADRWLPIRKSAKNLIRELSPLEGTRYLWIDAICINQDDQPEKHGQLRMMRDIYENSSQTIACLGDSVDAFAARKYLDYLSDRLEAQQQHHLYGRPLGSIGHEPAAALRLQARAFWNLLNLDYWSRAWIIQELVVGRSVKLLYGGYSIELETFLALMVGFNTFGDDGPVLALDDDHGNVRVKQNALTYIKSIAVLWDGHKEDKQFPLSHVLVECCQAQSSEAQDKVLALVGLSADATIDDLQPSADGNVDELQSSPNDGLEVRKYKDALRGRRAFIAAVKHELKKNHFSLLSIAGMSQPRKLLVSLPSWVPDLSTPPTLPPFDQMESPYTAGRPGSSNFSVLEPGTILEIEGFQLSRIKDIADVTSYIEEQLAHSLFPTSAYGRGLSLGKQMRCIQRVLIDNIENPYPFTCQSRGEAFWRTLIGDEMGGVCPAKDRIGTDFAVVLTRLHLLDPEISTLDLRVPYRHPISDAELIAAMRRIDALMGRKIFTRRFAVTEDGHMALVPPNAQAGNLIAVFIGSRVPHVLRRTEHADGTYELVGDAYVHGVMRGEALRPERGSVSTEMIRIR